MSKLREVDLPQKEGILKKGGHAEGFDIMERID